MHWPEYTVRSIEAAAAAANTVKDVLGTDRATFARTVATDTLNDMAAAVIGRLPYIAQGVAQKLWSELSAAIIERQVQRAVVQAPSLTVVDERTPGAPTSVELVDERGPVTPLDSTSETR
ncbi:MAG: hypothetical protein IV100_15105 [Myxococcales bacterium]|nr:hypothetical protein [Myxococcales bacterium]